MTTKAVKAGDELFTHYGYASEFGVMFDVPWYWDLKRQVEKEERLEANRAKLTKIKRKNHKRYGTKH